MKPHDSNISACRICQGALFKVLQLEDLPLANSLADLPNEEKPVYPIIIKVCEQCASAQLDTGIRKEVLYSNYSFATPDSITLTKHYRSIIDQLLENDIITKNSKVVEIGSNNGAFLKELSRHASLCIGVDPISPMDSNDDGCTFIREYFDVERSSIILTDFGQFDLIISRHCMAHNVDLFALIDGVDVLLNPNGTLIIENSYWPSIIERGCYDQFYHEHIYYHTIKSISHLVGTIGMEIVQVKLNNVQGGSMQYCIKKKNQKDRDKTNFSKMIEIESNLSLRDTFSDFQKNIDCHIIDLRATINNLCSRGKTIHAYGASAKASTLINTLKLTENEIPIIIDSTPSKQGKYIPNTGIVICSEGHLISNWPDYYLITIWNYADEVINKVKALGNTKSKFIIPFPKVHII
ncbi:MAG: methyltransferase domain-containing protein [Saprospiraceae bacterium]